MTQPLDLRRDDPTRPTPMNTPAQVLRALVDLNEYNGHFQAVVDELHWAMDLLRRQEEDA